MAGLKELKRRLQSVKNTRKTTYAMKLVSAAKLRRVQETVVRAREYQVALEDLLSQLVATDSGEGKNLKHPLIEARAGNIERENLLIVVGGSRGLAGGYNANLLRALDRYLDEQPKEPKIIVIGRKPAEYLRRRGFKLLNSFESLPEDPFDWPIETILQSIVLQFIEQSIKEVVVLYTHFSSALSVLPRFERVLPLSVNSKGKAISSNNRSEHSKKLLLEPSRGEVLDQLLPRILQTKIRHFCFHAKASEHGSRMTAMDAATKNADELTYKLQLTYNKVRQSGITSELLDILGGAEAIK